MQLRLTRNYAVALALGEAFALLATSLTLTAPLQARNLLAINKPAQSQLQGTSQQKGGTEEPANAFKKADGSGTLVAMLPGGKQLGQCALKHTDVSCDIAGYIARVTVKQTFHNPFKNKIEALYTFPLSDSGAVDEMVMKIGDRTVHGTIKKREEARQIYEQAKANGQVASLLDQERTNIFNQSVANIEPGKEIEITIKYVETLPYENGKYTFAFPTVVGPRFIPGSSDGKTPAVQDAALITPPIAPAGERSGHDLSINVKLNAGLPISDLASKLHDVNITNKSGGQASISLVDKNTIPNKDFVLNWGVAQDNLKSGYLTYKDPAEKDGYFTLMLMPPKRVTPDKIAAKEMVFVIDCSGSQSGPPLQKAKETMNYILDHMNGDDTFQIIAFSSTTRRFASQPEKVSEAMKDKAHKFISSLEANGGTWMAPAVEEACKIPADGHRLRIVTFMTDGYVGNDFEVIGMVKKMRGTSRWFPFGTGNSVNRMLIDGIAKEGGGEPDYVLLNSSGSEVGKKFYDRISSPMLTDVKLEIQGVKVKEVYPREISDVWAERPLYFKGKYTAGGAGSITLTGYIGDKPYSQKLAVNFPDNNTANPGIASLWARAKVDRLMSEDYAGAQNGAVSKELKDEIMQTALTHHIMTQYTSFVAVDEKTVTKNGKLETVTVPVELPDGASGEHIFGQANTADALSPATLGGSSSVRAKAAYGRAGRGINGSYGGFAGGAGGTENYMSVNRSLALPSGQAAFNGPAASTGSYGRRFPLVSTPAPSGKKSLQIAAESPTVEDLRSVDKTKRDEGKLSKDAQIAADDSERKTETPANRDKRLAVRITLAVKDPLNAKQIESLKKLGFEFETGHQSKQKTRQVRGTLPASRLKALAALDFILSVILDSDRK